MAKTQYYGDMVAEGKTPPAFHRMLAGCIGYMPKDGRPVFYGRDKASNKSTPKNSQIIPQRKARVGNGVPKALRDWYPDSFQ